MRFWFASVVASCLIFQASLTLALPLDPNDLLGLRRAADELGVEGRRTVQEFLKAVEKATGESEVWRETVDRMRHDLANIPPDLGIEGRAFVDFTIERARANLDAMVEIKQLIDKKEYPKSLTLFLAMQKKFAATHPPVISNLLPKLITLKWSDSKTFGVDGGVNSIILTGWNLTPGDEGVALVVLDKDSKKVREVTTDLQISNPYICHIDVSGGSGIKFREGDHALVMTKDGKQIVRIPLVWANVPPPPPRLVTSLRFTYHTMDEDKDSADGHVGAEVYWAGKQLAKGTTENSDDPRMVWPDGSVRGPYALALNEPVPLNKIGEVRVLIAHWRGDGDPAWRFRVQSIMAVLDDNSERLVCTEDDQRDLYNHRPSRPQWHSFDLRGGRNDRLKTPEIPLRLH